MMLAPLMAALALAQAGPFQGGYFDAVGSPTSLRLTRLIIEVPEGALPIQPCKDDCVRASLDAVIVGSDRVVFEISVTESYADRIVRDERISGECPAGELDICARQARIELNAFAATRHRELLP